MNIKFPAETYSEIKRRKPVSEALKQEDRSWGCSIEARLIDPADYALLLEVAGSEKARGDIENRRILRQVKGLQALQDPKSKDKLQTTLPLFSEALRRFVGALPNKVLFKNDEVHGTLLPRLVTKVEFHEAQRTSPARVELSTVHWERGENKEESFSFHQEQVSKKRLQDILMKRGLMPETQELQEAHVREVSDWNGIHGQTGEQFTAQGAAHLIGKSSWSREVDELGRDGEPDRAVMDDEIDFGTAMAVKTLPFWDGKGDEDEDESLELPVHAVPIHPVLRVFSLTRHEFFLVHISKLKKYVYDPELSGMVILPDEHRKLISLLVGGAKGPGDMIRGKGQGTIILCTGAPGTGKTLTAEAYSEKVERPLYTVQCSQLGISAEDLEKNLSEVLSRAQRWRAVLLIDEADVYIRDRGEDVNQNAIVGVFLRVLEYYKGILFMNTNRQALIDDAILSRATVHLVYGTPSPKNALLIWAIMSRRYGVSIVPADMARQYPNSSGRDIRNACRLAAIVASGDGRGATCHDVEFAFKYAGSKD